MLYLHQSLSAWGSDRFRTVLCRELARQPADNLCLQQALVQGSVALDDAIMPLVISISELPHSLLVKCGVHYTGMVAGCSCADDPTPQETTTEYCELWLEIDRRTAATTVRLSDDAADS